ncbi:MAG: gamma-glutamyltransferase [Kineosporiaceae bacterium]
MTATGMPGAAVAATTSPGVTSPATAARATSAKVPTAVGHGGAAAIVDADATRVAVDVLRRGGNAVDAAVAAAATLGVTEPYSAGIGGGGFFVYYDAKHRRVSTLDGRESAPAAMRADSFAPGGVAIPFAEAVTSGLSVGVPGTLATWQSALSSWGSLSLRQALQPAIAVAQNGFAVDATFRQQTADNAARFADFPATKALFLPGGQPPAVGSVFRNPDLARTYRLIAQQGPKVFYRGAIGTELVKTAQAPPVDPAATRVVRPGLITQNDLAGYRVIGRAPTHIGYRGLDVYGMAPPSSGGSTVAEALNILERSSLSRLDRTQALHRYLEASGLAFADRNRYVGDPAAVEVPLKDLLSDAFAAERACLITAASTLPRPIAPGVPSPENRIACGAAASGAAAAEREGLSTTHLTVADRWGNVVAYTLTIEQTGGSGIVVPGRGFLLNNELTDFNFTDTQGGHDPNLPAPGKRPRSSMAPTIVLSHGTPLLAVGSPGGATIITTVLQTLLNRLDFGMTLPQAIAAPRVSERNGTSSQAEPGFATAGLAALGHTFSAAPEIGAATGVELLRDGRVLAAAEPTRRGGGSAGVVRP